MREFVAVDAGGTSSRAVVVDEEGRVLGAARAGGGNPTSRGFDDAAAAITAAIGAAVGGIGRARSSGSRIERVLVAHAGSASGFAAAIAERLVPAGIGAPVRTAGDLAALFASGTPEVDGVAVIAGTGAIGGAVRGGEVVRLVDGTGWLLGDAGSGFWIGHRVARAVVDDLDGGPATRLTGAVLAALDLPVDRTPQTGRPRAVGDLVERLYGQRPVELAGLAPLAFELAGEDAVASTVVREAVDALATLLRRVRAFQGTGPVVLGGGVLVQGVLRLGSSWAAPLVDAAGGAPLVAADGVVGAAVLALRSGGVPVDAPLFARLVEQLR